VLVLAVGRPLQGGSEPVCERGDRDRQDRRFRQDEIAGEMQDGADRAVSVTVCRMCRGLIVTGRGVDSGQSNYRLMLARCVEMDVAERDDELDGNGEQRQPGSPSSMFAKPTHQPTRCYIITSPSRPAESIRV
jgi:hypothetical protein